MSSTYVALLVMKHPAIKEVWLIGSHANGTAGPESDWDYVVFADEDVLNQLRSDKSLKHTEMDLLVVYDGDHFEEPWPDGEHKKHGSLSGWQWHRGNTASEATYRATKAKYGDDFGVSVTERSARRIWPLL